MNRDNLTVTTISEEAGVIKSVSAKYGVQLWTLGRMTKKKVGKPCYLCENKIEKMAYRPITNLSNRMQRICDRHKFRTEDER